MSGRTLSLFEAAIWGAKVSGEAIGRKDAQGVLFMDDVQVETIQVRGMFSVLGCANGRTQVVLTSFLRLVPGPTPSTSIS
jgi:hypothetical protein